MARPGSAARGEGGSRRVGVGAARLCGFDLGAGADDLDGFDVPVFLAPDLRGVFPGDGVAAVGAPVPEGRHVGQDRGADHSGRGRPSLL